MADQQDDDALFDRLAKSLEAVRYDAELARTGGVAGITASVTRAETELHRVAGELAELRRRVDAQERSAAADGSAVAQSAAEMRSLREAVELLSRRVEAHEARLAVRERSRSWAVGRVAPLVALLVVILAGAAAWAGFGLRPTPRELADRFTTRLAELAGFQPPPRIEAASVSAPEPASVSPTAAPPAEPAPSTAPSLASNALPAPPLPAVAVPAPAAGPAPGPAPGPAASVAATPAVVPPAAVTPSPVARPSASGSETASAAPSTATPSAGESPASVTSQTIDAAGQASAETSPAKPVQQVLLRATADSWVDIRQKGGRTLLRRTMRPGDTWPIPADPTLLLNSGNAGRLELVVDGVATRLVPAKTGTVRDLPLDPESIAADLRPHP